MSPDAFHTDHASFGVLNCQLGGEWVAGGIRTLYVIVKERHETIMGYKPRERVALEWFIPIIVELLVL